MESESPQNNNKIYIIIGIIIAIIIVFIVAFLYFRSRNTPEATPNQNNQFPQNSQGPIASVAPGETTSTGNLPGSRLVRLAEGPVEGAAPRKNINNIRYFEKTTGHLYEIPFDGGEASRVSDATILGIQRVSWSPSKTYAIITYEKDGSLVHRYARYTASSSITSAGFFPANVLDIAFAPDEDKIVYQVSSGTRTNIVTALPDNSKKTTVYTTEIPDILLAWPTKSMVSLQTRASTHAPSYLYSLNLTSGQFSKVLNESYGLQSLWSPKGDAALLSTTRNTTTGLYLYTLKDGTSKQFDFATLPEKCMWSKKQTRVLFCAVPQAIQGLELPDAWWQGKVGFYDSLWKIDLESGKNTQLLQTYAIDIINIVASDDEKYLFFSNKNDGSLWSLKIAE